LSQNISVSDKTSYQKNYWEEERPRRSPDHPVVEASVRPKLNYISEFVKLKNDAKLLDVGCGNGFFTFYFANIFDTMGLDYSDRMLSINPCEKLIQGSATMLPFKDNSFDIVFCSGLLHHVKDPIDVILEMKRVSNKYVVLCEPNRNNPLMALFAAIVPEERGALKFSLKYMNKAAKKCGLNIIDSCSMGAIVPNKTPMSMLELFKIIDIKMPLGFDNLVISCK
jgi:SAM-dependent methyltransferase